MKPDCLWLNDIECPYATGYQDCDNCDKYIRDERKHPLDDSDQADYLRDIMKENSHAEGN